MGSQALEAGLIDAAINVDYQYEMHHCGSFPSG